MNHFLLIFILKPYDQELNFSCITVNAHVSLSSERETAIAKYVGVNKLVREILIERALFHGKICYITHLSVQLRGDVHAQVAMLNVSMTFGGGGGVGVGVVDLDDRIVAK